MRILGISGGGEANRHYRMLVPLSEMHRRGHRVDRLVVLPSEEEAARMTGWDAVMMQQLCVPVAPRLVAALRRAGIAVVWDTDDDISSAPLGLADFRGPFGRRDRKRTFARTVEVATAADLVTTTNEHLADVYRAQGVDQAIAIENYLAPHDARRARRRHAGIVIGIVASAEHEADLNRMGIGQALQRILSEHEGVRVVVIGPDVEMGRARHRYIVRVPFDRLLDHESEFDVGLAPLRDTPFNRSRSNVKLKEYAAAGATWLASPVGPYRGLGEEQGGRLVADGEWFDALDALVRDPTRRAALRKRATAWARRETVERGAKAWETAFATAIRRAGDRRALRV